MELTMTNGFCEMNEMEMQEVDGGICGIALSLLICVGGGAILGGTAIDLMNCYSNGYNDVMYGK